MIIVDWRMLCISVRIPRALKIGCLQKVFGVMIWLWYWKLFKFSCCVLGGKLIIIISWYTSFCLLLCLHFIDLAFTMAASGTVLSLIYDLIKKSVSKKFESVGCKDNIVPWDWRDSPWTVVLVAGAQPPRQNPTSCFTTHPISTAIA